MNPVHPKHDTQKRQSATPAWLTPVVAGAALLAIVWVERRRPLRERREGDLRHTTRNLVTAAMTAAITTTVQARWLAPLVTRVEEQRLGLLPRLALPRAVRVVIGVVLLDYTLWWWHWLNHRVPALWRLHLVHHVDLDLDASTAIRFHFGEMSLSVFYRMAQVRLLGVDRVTLSLWQLMLLVSIFFHHSNIRLPLEAERRLSRMLVTPRMHGIHHSIVEGETNSNWASLLTWWDLLHGTFREDVPQETITIGVPAYQAREDVTLPKIIALPFREQRDDFGAVSN